MVIDAPCISFLRRHGRPPLSSPYTPAQRNITSTTLQYWQLFSACSISNTPHPWMASKSFQMRSLWRRQSHNPSSLIHSHQSPPWQRLSHRSPPPPPPSAPAHRWRHRRRIPPNQDYLMWKVILCSELAKLQTTRPDTLTMMTMFTLLWRSTFSSLDSDGDPYWAWSAPIL